MKSIISDVSDVRIIRQKTRLTEHEKYDKIGLYIDNSPKEDLI